MGFVVFAGQSNMGGYGQDAGTLPAAWKPDPLTLIWNDQAGAWEQMQPGVNTGYSTFTQTWGPEVQFAVDFRAEHPNETLRIVKVVAGGTQLAADATPGVADWSPASPGELFDITTQILQRASAAVDYLRPTAVFWGQGEEDANYAGAAGAYGQNLAQLLTAVRSDWLNDPSGKVGFFRIGTSPVYADQVRAGELATDQADPNADSFDAANFPHQSDNLHYTSGGLDQVGDAFYQLYRAWPPGNEGPGLSGNDTLEAPVSGGPIHGGPGADVFTFPNEPWAPVHITDFVVGQDRIDLSPLFQKIGYAGSDPVADRYVILQSDGAGGTQVLFDHDGPDRGDWPNYIADVEHVGLATWSQLTSAPTGSPPPPPPPPPSGQGQVLTASTTPATLTGGAGDDTLNASQGADQLTGGAGADKFAWANEPWAPAHVADFVAGTDKLDLTALLQQAGYTGTDPVADHYLTLQSDGAGGTQILFDPDGTAPGHQWPDYIIDLDHTAVTTWAQLTGGTASPPPPSPPPPPPPSGQGQVLTATTTPATLTGGAGDDTLSASQGADQLTGGAGADKFAWANEPWAPAHVADFVIGQDRLDLSAVLQQAGYAGTDPVSDRYVILQSDGAGGTQVLFDPDGTATGHQWPDYIINLDHASVTTWAQLTGGTASPPPPPPSPPPPPPPPGDAGQTLTAAPGGSNLAGGAGADTLIGSNGPDTLTGAGGADHFVLKDVPWQAGHITDFAEGVDKIDVSGMLAKVGWSGTNAIADGYIKLFDDGQGGTWVYFDSDGPGTADQWGTFVAALDHVSPGTLTAGDWIFK